MAMRTVNEIISGKPAITRYRGPVAGAGGAVSFGIRQT